MKILIEKPPIYDEAHKHFDIDDDMTIYTYGDAIYNPSDCPIPREIIVHESCHSFRQNEHAGGAQGWWEQYFIDIAFRIQEEVEAYNAQWKDYCSTHKDRNDQARYLHKIASILASPMYKGNITISEATKRIKTYTQLIHKPDGFI